jgi:hypothetical protein
MNYQQITKLAITDLREKVIGLTEEFDTRNKLGMKNYSQRLDNFLKRRIGNVADKILVEQIFISMNSLKLQNSNI